MAEQKKIKVTVKKKKEPVQQEGIVCPECGHVNPADSRFCGQCGTNLNKTEITVEQINESDVAKDKPVYEFDGAIGKIEMKPVSSNIEGNLGASNMGGNLGASLGAEIMKTLFNSESGGSRSKSNHCSPSSSSSSTAPEVNWDKNTVLYADAIVADLRDRFSAKFPFEYYGGSTYPVFCEKRAMGSLSYPAVLVVAKLRPIIVDHFDRYLVWDRDNGYCSVPFDRVSTYPFSMDAEIWILHDENSEYMAYDFASCIVSEYGYNKKTVGKNSEILVNAAYSDLPVLLKAKCLWRDKYTEKPHDYDAIEQYDKRKQKSLEETEFTKKVDMCFETYKSPRSLLSYSISIPFIWQDYQKEDLNKPSAQLALLKAALSCYDAVNHLTRVRWDSFAREKIEYRDGKKLPINKSNELIIEKFSGDRSISREEFEQGIENVIDFYPQLYDCFNKGWSVEEVSNEIDSIISMNKARTIQILKDCGIPSQIDTGIVKYQLTPFAKDYDNVTLFLSHFIAYLGKNRPMLIADALPLFIKHKEEEKLDWEARMEARSERNEQRHQDVSDIGKIALGSAIGAGLKDRKKRKEAKKEKKRKPD